MKKPTCRTLKLQSGFRSARVSVKRFVKQWRETGTVTPHPPSTGPSPKLDEAGMTVLKTLVKMQGDASQDELRVLMAQETGNTRPVSPTISRALSRGQESPERKRPNAPQNKTGKTSKPLVRRLRRNGRPFNRRISLRLMRWAVSPG